MHAYTESSSSSKCSNLRCRRRQLKVFTFTGYTTLNCAFACKEGNIKTDDSLRRRGWKFVFLIYALMCCVWGQSIIEDTSPGFTPPPSLVSVVHLNTAHGGPVQPRPAPPPPLKPPLCLSQLIAGPERGGFC